MKKCKGEERKGWTKESNMKFPAVMPGQNLLQFDCHYFSTSVKIHLLKYMFKK